MSRRSAESPSDCSPPKKLQKEEHVHNETHLENDILSSSSYSTSNRPISISKLPVEVMTHIFRFMSLRERLNALLVCKDWHEAASHPTYYRDEKLVLRDYEDCEELLKLLLKTKRKILLLEFRSCNLSGSNLLSIADKIHYLSFHNCKLSSTLLFEVFTKFVNLEEFYFYDRPKPEEFYIQLIPCFNRQFMELLEHEHFLNENLKTLSVSGRETNLTSHNIQSLFKMFPNIRHFSFRFMKLLTNNHFPIGSIEMLTQGIISLKNTLEHLKIAALEPQLRSLVPHDFTRLRRISLSIQEHIPEALIFDFFSRLKCLEQISFSCVFESSFPTRFFKHLIHQCPNLKRLKLRFRLSCHIDLSPEMFRALLSSKLTSLKIIAANIRPTSDELFATSMNLPANKSLRVLRIPTVIDHRIQCLFIQSFTNLSVLNLECFSGTVLESIGQFQKNLTTLSLKMINYGFPGIEERIVLANIWHSDQLYNCLQSLACLENLSLNFASSIVFNCKFVPPSVKYLQITLLDFSFSTSDSKTDNHLILVLKEKTELESIYFASKDYRKIDLDMWSEICCSLKKLRFLSLHGCSSTPRKCAMGRKRASFVETPETLFERCPSLRLFARTSSSIWNYYNLLHYDYVHRKMKNVDPKSEVSHYFTIDKIMNSKIKFHLSMNWCDY